MVGREYDYIRGNTAVNPYKRPRTIEEERKSPRKRKNNKPRVKTYKIRKTKGIVGIAVMFFLVGGLTVGSYGSLFHMQKSLSEMKSEIRSLKSENEAMSVDLLKFSSIHKIREAATEKDMALPVKSKTVDVKWSSNYFKDIK